MKLNCWEFMKCGKDNAKSKTSEVACPALSEKSLDGVHGGRDAGRACWVVAGTLCGGNVQGMFAEKLGIPREDIVIDCLSLAVGAETTSGTTALGTIRLIKQKLGVNMTLAVSNFSFGLPDRELLNNAFVAACIAAGVTCVIVDVKKVRPAVLAADLILAHDKYARRYVENFRQRQQQAEK